MNVSISIPLLENRRGDAVKGEVITQCFNEDLVNLVTPVKEQLLIDSNYNKKETQFLVDGFRNGFDIGYQGPEHRQDTARNIPFTVGNQDILWEKIMTEVKERHYAGPFKEIPFDDYIQSPIGLVPKAGNKTRLIFHISFDFKQLGNLSVNGCMLKELCSVKYNDLDNAIQNCFVTCDVNQPIFFARTDVQSAFRILPLKIKCIKWLVMKAVNPLSGELCYFVEKCLLFGSSISCSHFQRFSNALKHIYQWRVGRVNRKSSTNYLDDFLFITRLLSLCNQFVNTFLQICSEVGVPIATEKTVWGCMELYSLVCFLRVQLGLYQFQMTN